MPSALDAHGPRKARLAAAWLCIKPTATEFLSAVAAWVCDPMGLMASTKTAPEQAGWP